MTNSWLMSSVGGRTWARSSLVTSLVTVLSFGTLLGVSSVATATRASAAPSGVVVSVGYADSANGLTPWSGSPNTIFIGEPHQCCSTHGPDNGGLGYDAGAIEIENTSASSVTVNAVTLDFGGGSSPSHYDLWGSGVSPALPQTLAPGTTLVLTSTATFNFDTSDLFGEACHINSGVVPVVHVTVDGTQTDYNDDHQILNSDGADLASCPGDVSEQEPFAVVNPGSQTDAIAVNDVPPAVTVAGPAGSPTTPAVGRIVSGFAGGWNASPPPALTLQWTRCDSGGNGCADIAGANGATYRPTASDVGSRLRLRVTASNNSGSAAMSSDPTLAVQNGPAIAQLGHTVTGFTSTFVNNLNELRWAETATASGTAKDFAFFARGAGNDQLFTPKIFADVNGNEGALLATGAAINVPKGLSGQWYVSALSSLQLTQGTQYIFALDPSGSFNGTYVGAETNGETSFFVDYTLPASVPGAPTIGTALAGDGSASVTFSPPANNGGSAITGFTVTCTSSDGGASASASGSGSPITVFGLSNGNSYTCVAFAKNAVGPSAPSNASNQFSPVAAPTVPGPPTIGAAVARDSGASVAFSPPGDDGRSAITGYVATCTSSNGGASGSASGTSSPIVVAGLTNGRSYTCAVIAQNGIGPSAQSSASNQFVPAAPVKPPPPPLAATGYWMLGRDGRIYPFGDAKNFGSSGAGAVAIATRRDGRGYWTTDSLGVVRAFGTAGTDGGRPALHPGERVSTISATPSGQGYWVFTNEGRVFPHGDAHFYGDLGGVALNGGVVASIATPTGHGYYMVGSDGGVFSFGDARFRGSMGGRRLRAPIIGISPTLDNRGYWLTASDGGVFAFAAPFRGSLGGVRLNQPIDGLVSYGNGYLMVASDGGVFDFSDRPFVGSLGGQVPSAPIIGIAAFAG